MAAGLFDAPPPTAAGPAAEPDDAGGYRALSAVAVASALFALGSPLAFVDWWLAVVPALGLALGSVALRDIARRPDTLTGRPIALAAVLASAVMLPAGLVRLSLAYAAELPPGFTRLSYAELQPLPGDPPTALPDTARAVDGRDVLLKGYMYPGKQQAGIREFLLVRDQGDCCFGGNPKLTDRVRVQIAEPAGIPFSPRLVKIAGRFHIHPLAAPGLDGGVLYHIEDARVR